VPARAACASHASAPCGRGGAGAVVGALPLFILLEVWAGSFGRAVTALEVQVGRAGARRLHLHASAPCGRGGAGVVGALPLLERQSPHSRFGQAAPPAQVWWLRRHVCKGSRRTRGPGLPCAPWVRLSALRGWVGVGCVALVVFAACMQSRKLVFPASHGGPTLLLALVC